MFFKQYYLACLSHASYMIGDLDAGVACVIDPQRDVQQYINDAKVNHLQITRVILTHFHADFLAGHIELRDNVGATICLGVQAEAEFDFLPLSQGDEMIMGDVRLVTWETPGHTPEGISILVYNLAESQSVPYAVLTGDALFIGDVGRPDLLASIGVTAEELSEMLYDSVHNKLAKLPHETRVYPAHGAGSMCGKNLSDDTVSTIGEQLKYNYAMQPMTLQEFQSVVLEDQPEAPAYFAHDAMLNRQERPNLAKTMSSSLEGLSLETTIQHQLDPHVLVVDVRDAIDFEGAHLRHAINIGLRGKFATWAGTILPKNGLLIVVADSGDEEEAIMRLGRIGFDNVIGYLDGGMATVGDRSSLLAVVNRMTARSTYEAVNGQHPPLVLDIRTERERSAGFIQGSLSIPLNQLSSRLEQLDRNQTLIVHCQGGYRSAIACSVLQKYGFLSVNDLIGGFNAWKASDLPVQLPADSVRS